MEIRAFFCRQGGWDPWAVPPAGSLIICRFLHPGRQDGEVCSIAGVIKTVFFLFEGGERKRQLEREIFIIYSY